MTRARFDKLRREVIRRVYLQQAGTLKGYGTHLKMGRVNWDRLHEAGIYSYDDVWNYGPMKSLRETVGM